MYRRSEEVAEQATSGTPENRIQFRKKETFRKSASAEPVMSEGGKAQRKKHFTTFWSSLFGTKIPENRLSGISTQSSSFESVNTILSTNSFSFVSPKKYKGKHKGKRIPLPVEEPPKPKRKISTLTRIGMRIGLKSKYNLQSCESLQNLNYLESKSNSDGGTLSSTHRRKRQAPLPPHGTLPRNNCPLPQSNSSIQANDSPTNKSPLSKFNSLKYNSHKNSSSKTKPPLIKVNSPPPRSISPEPSTSFNLPSCSKSIVQQKEKDISSPEVSKEQNSPGSSTAAFTTTFTSDTYTITAGHRRSSSDGTSRNSPKPKIQSNTLSNTYKTKSHVRGKRKAPVPPNPFGDPDAPEEEVNEDLAIRKPTAAVSLPTAAAVNTSENEPTESINANDITTRRMSSPVNAEVTTTAQSDTQTEAVASSLLPAQEQDEEIAQNILNDKQEQRSVQQLQQQEHADPQPGPTRRRPATVTEQELEAAQQDLQALIAISSHQNKAVLDEPTRVQLAQLKREADKSPLMFLQPKSYLAISSPSGSKSPSGSNDNHFNFNLEREHERNSNPPASPNFHSDESLSPSETSRKSPLFLPTTSIAGSPTKITPRPWYKRNITSGSNSSKKSKQLIKPVSSMTKFSDIDREASRIVEENKRRSAEQAYNESARELITTFNAFNKFQITATPTTETDGELSATQNNTNETSEQVGRVTRSSAQASAPAPSTTGITANSGPPSNATSDVRSDLRKNDSSTTKNSITSDSRNSNDTRDTITNTNFGSSSIFPTSSATGNNSRLAGSRSVAEVLASKSPKKENSQDKTDSQPSTSTSAAAAAAAVPIETTEKPKKLAIVQPQSCSRVNAIKSTGGSTNSEANINSKVSVGISTSAFLSSKRENWTCPRCTLQNSYWRLTCDVCFFKVEWTESTVQKLSSVFENASGASGSDGNRNEKRSEIKPILDSVTAGASSSNGSGTKPEAIVKDTEDVPFCENFLSQLPAKQTLGREGKLVGMKLHEETGEELDVVKLRQARLAFFEKNVSAMDDESSCKFTCVSTLSQQEYGGADEAIVSNNLATESNEGRKEVIEKKELNVFCDDEDNSIDALLEIPRFGSQHAPLSTKDPTNMPTFSGPNRSWNPLHHLRFRPMLESILESSNDVYLRLNPIYENWDVSQNQCASSSTNSSVAPPIPTGRTWTNTFTHMHDPILHNSPTDNNNGYYANSNSGSSSCSEYESQGLGSELISGMDGKNRAPSSLHSSHHHYLYANQDQGQGDGRQDRRKLTIEDYRKLGAIPKNLEGYYNSIPSPPDGSGSSYRERSGRSADNSYAKSTVAVNKLLRKLEIAISKGDHRLAATLAHDLALLKVNCVVAKGEQKNPTIKIRVYVEDRFMQQGPFQVEITQAMSVEELKKKIEIDWNIPAAFQKWILGRKMAEDEKQTLGEFDVEHDTMAFLYIVTPQIERRGTPAITQGLQITESNETPRKLEPSTQIIPETRSTSTSVITTSSSVIGKKPVDKNELLTFTKVPEIAHEKLSTTIPSGNETNNIGKKAFLPPVSSLDAEVIKVTQPSNKILPAMKATSSNQVLPQSPNKTIALTTNIEKQNVIVKKVTSKSTPRTSEQLPKPPQNIKPSSTEPCVEVKKIPLETPTSSGVKSTELFIPQVPVVVQRGQKKAKAKNEINIQKNEPHIVPVVESPANAETPTNPGPQVPVASVLTTPKYTGANRPKQEDQSVPSKVEVASGKSNGLNLNPIANTKEQINGTKSVKIPLHIQTKTELLNRKKSDVPNWNPEPVPKRRTKNKINTEINVPVIESAEIKPKNISPVTNVESDTKVESPATVPPKPPKNTTSQIKTEHTYYNGASIPANKSPSPTPVPPEPGTRVQNQDIPPPLPEKKLLNKEIKEVNSVVDPVPSPSPVVVNGLVLPKAKFPLVEENNLIDTRSPQPPVIIEDTNNDPTDINAQAAAVAVTEETTNKKEDNRETYLRMLHLMEQSDLINNVEELDCPICFLSIQVNEGVVLRDCLHSFCKECLIGSVKYADEPEIKCPFRDDKYSCNSVMQEREIKALVPPEIFELYLARSVKVAECKIVNTFHCKTADCTGWCVFEDDVNVFNCPVCKKRNCLTCQAIHEGVDCQQYQRQLAIDSETDENAKSSRLMLEKMIQRGEALECPACHVVLLKKWGCDWVRCSYCKTEICWITKGFRWGPNGKGDTSGGCRCGLNGVRCHPKCTYCH
ncbi:unnamed protein product [Allacma fusca]|uniref:RanBP-type and C3HC4-type zinc finger-containing protein 1 n=1 Tax=Allacma fusca TaxID=39272 RepID=A0A8J2Q6Q5_9HEXA|nr:unnamed protein product [Allacma fusca]